MILHVARILAGIAACLADIQPDVGLGVCALHMIIAKVSVEGFAIFIDLIAAFHLTGKLLIGMIDQMLGQTILAFENARAACRLCITFIYNMFWATIRYYLPS